MNDITYAGLRPSDLSQRRMLDVWVFLYCTAGRSQVLCDQVLLSCCPGDVVVIPPQTPFACADASDTHFIQLHMDAPALAFASPAIVTDDEHHFLLNAFHAALHHFHTEGPQRTELLHCYGALISCTLTACQQNQPSLSIAAEIERCIQCSFTDPTFKLDRYFSTLPFSSGYLRKLFQKEYGTTPQQYLLDIRLQTAAEALLHARHTGVSVGDIATRCGFRDPLYFSKMFRKRYGIPPSQYAQQSAGSE